MPVPAFESIDAIVSRSVSPRRFQMNVAVLFALTALTLTSLGLYSALTDTTKRRTREIAVRIALGAGPFEISRTVLAQAIRPVGWGLAAGFGIALTTPPLLSGLLFGIAPADVRVFALAAIVLGGVALLAAAGPSLRASRVNPADAMRTE
jgi:putative ABC transport system permease protein